MDCLICNNYKNNDLKAFSVHLQMKHKIKSIDYTIQYLCDGLKSTCKECGEHVRYVGFSFRKYCKDHSHMAESEAGKIGGKIKKTWNKGKTKENDERIMEYSIKYTGEGNPFYGKKHPRNIIDLLRKNSYLSKEDIEKRLDKRKKEFEFHFDYNDYVSRQYQYIKLKCKVCGFDDEKTLMDIERGSRCAKCFPLNVSSQPEQEIEDYIKSIDNNIIIERNTRNVISPKELDIYIPQNKLAIEYNGLFWHSEERVGRDLHMLKTEYCLRKDIQLVHIFSDEWYFKKDIVKSMIMHRLKKSSIIIYARNCVLKEIENKLARDFFIKTHIAADGGNIKKSFALFYDGKMVACLSLKDPYKVKNDFEEKTIENARFSLELNTCVVGGFSKLLKKAVNWSKKENYIKMKSFADRRFGEGKVYEKCGFSLIGKTKSNYWYSNSEKRFFRTHFRARFGKSEKQIVEENKVFRVYGCGSNIYELIL